MILTVYICLGSVSTLNGLVAVLLTWLAMSAYIIKEVKVPSLKSDVYITPTEKHTVVTSISDIRLLAGLIHSSLRGNEFFKVEDIESKVGLNETLISEDPEGLRKSFPEALTIHLLP